MTTPRPPTERQLARLTAALRKAEAQVASVWNREKEAQRAVRKRFYPQDQAATKAVQAARAALIIAELAKAGILPGHTILRWQGVHWAVRLKYSGYAELVPVKADNTRHECRNAIPMPSRLDWLEITDRVMKEKP